MELQEIITGICLGIALSACCGFRIFVPLLVASLAAKFDFVPLSSGFEWMNSWAAVMCFGVASVLEVFAYYFPVIDNLLDTLTTPGSIIAGTVISASMFTEIDPMTKWTLALIAGGGTAGVIQSGTGLLRLGSTKLTAGLGNPVVATLENIFSVIGSLLSLFIPVAMFVLFVTLAAGTVYLIAKRFVTKNT